MSDRSSRGEPGVEGAEDAIFDRLRERGTAVLERALVRAALPRIALQSPALVLPNATGEGLAGEVNTFTSLSLSAADDKAHALIERLQKAGASFSALNLGLLSPAARRLGDLWSLDEASFVDVNLGLDRLRQHMRFIAVLFGQTTLAAPVRRTVTVAVLPDEKHLFGAAMTAEFFRRAGWQVRFLPRTTQESLVAHVADTALDVLGLSLTRIEQAPACRALIAAIRATTLNPELVVVVGGPGLVSRPELFMELGADAALAALQFAPARAGQMVDARHASQGARRP